MKRWLLRLALLALAACLAYLLFWPVPVAPVAWSAPAAPRLEGPFAVNDRLAAVEWLGRGKLRGPEATAVDSAGRVYTGVRDGRILRFDPASGAFDTFARAGAPLGMAFDPAGDLVVCDAERGLLSVSPAGAVAVLATGHRAERFRFLDDVDVGPDGTAYFTDASSRFGLGHYREDILEHGGAGRLLAWHPATRATEVLLAGLQFANGVAVSGDGAFVAVNETGAYRVRRYWLVGPRKGTADTLVDNLPGFPDNITWSRQRRAFWVALFSPRVPALDLLSGWPFLRKAILRLPLWAQPQPARHAIALAVDAEGRVLENLQHRSAEAYAPMTSVRESGGFLYLGSLEREALGRIPAPPLPGAAR